MNIEKYPHLHGLNLADLSDRSSTSNQIDILIGADHYYNIVTGDTESLGITDIKPVQLNSFEENLKDVTHDGIRYNIGLPWKETEAKSVLSCSYNSNYNRLRSLLLQLQKTPTLLEEYDRIFKEQEENNIIEKVPEEQYQAESTFLPHHAVVRQDRDTTKLRIVFDGSAKSKEENLSINDLMETGLNLIPQVLETLGKFRSYPVAMVADIKQAFHQIGIKEEDKDNLRFMWVNEINNDKFEVVQMRFCS